MTEEQYKAIVVLDDKINTLMKAYETLSAENVQLKKEVASLSKALKEKDNLINNICTKYDNLKNAKSLVEVFEDSKKTKTKLNGMVREIDKCIKLLNI